MRRIGAIVFFYAAFLCAESGNLEIGAGAYSIFKPQYLTGEVKVEYTFSYDLHKFKPLLGGMATFKKDFYLYGGFCIDLVMLNHYIFSPNFAVGYYHHGEGRNLGYPLEFRTGLKLGYQFDSLYRVGLHFYHISNASIGTHNPGEESLELYFAIPI